MTGNQHKKSVRIINIIRLAIAESRFALVDLTAPLALTIVRYIDTYAMSISRKEAPLRARNTATEYSHPGCFSADNWKGRQTADFP